MSRSVKKLLLNSDNPRNILFITNKIPTTVKSQYFFSLFTFCFDAYDWCFIFVSLLISMIDYAKHCHQQLFESRINYSKDYEAQDGRGGEVDAFC